MGKQRFPNYYNLQMKHSQMQIGLIIFKAVGLLLEQCFFLILIMFIVAGCKQQEPIKTPTASSLPSLYITLPPKALDSILHDRDCEVHAEALLLSVENDTMYDGELTHIQTRGNTTFIFDKKSFTIKFPQKIRLLGLDRNRSFVLLANPCDESHIRNAMALDLARAFGIPASRYAYLRLYLNGEYSGLYQITNKVEVGRNTLNIIDLNKLNRQSNPRPLDDYTWFAYGRKKQTVLRKGVLLEQNPEDITGGYLLDNSGTNELYCRSVSGFVSAAGDPIRIRSPKYASPEEVEYIAELYDQMEAAVLASDGCNPETGKHYSDYIDVGSFARYYLLNEIFLNFDGGWTSFMMYKDSDYIDPKIYAGPAWDFDRTLGNPRFQKGVKLYNRLVVNGKRGIDGEPHSGGLLYHLMQHDDFVAVVKYYYEQEIGPICHNYVEAGYWDSIAENLHAEADKDNLLYGTRFSVDYGEAVSNTIDFLRQRIAFFDWFYSTEESERVKVTVFLSDNKKTDVYYPLGKPIYTPQAELRTNHDPVYELCYADTDSIVKDGTIFNEAQNLELHKRDPNWHEVQMRRVRKKLKKYFY